MSKSFQYMTDVQVKVIAILTRYLWLRWPARSEALRRVCTKKLIDGHWVNTFTCECCGTSGFRGNEVDVDHIAPRINPKTGFTTIDSWVERCLVNADGLQILCKACHKRKSAEEVSEGWERKRASKNPKRKKK